MTPCPRLDRELQLDKPGHEFHGITRQDDEDDRRHSSFPPFMSAMKERRVTHRVV